RQNSRRKIGHRQLLTTVRISEILTDGAKPSKKAAAKAETKTEAKADAAPKKAGAKEDAAPTAAAPLFKAPKGKADYLPVIHGNRPVAAKALNEQGIPTFAQLAALTDADADKIDAAMPFSADQIKDWREQAKELAQ